MRYKESAVSVLAGSVYVCMVTLIKQSNGLQLLCSAGHLNQFYKKVSSFYAIVPAHIYMLSKLHLSYSYSHTIFNHNFVQSGHCAGGNKRSTLGHGSADIPSHIAQVGVQEAKNVRGAAEQCAHAQGAAGEREREQEIRESKVYM